MLRNVFALIALFVFFNAPSVQAQVDPVIEVSQRASRLIDSVMATINLRAELFNEELAKVNIVKRLDSSSLNKDVLPQNKEKIKNFLNYLEVYRMMSAKSMKAVTDSVEDIRSSMPSKLRSGFLKEFLESYETEQTTFEKYTLALTRFFSDVMEVFLFMENSKVAILDNKFQFTSKEESEKYNKLIEQLQKSNKKLITAGANMQRANIDASATMQKAYNSIGK